MKPIHEQSWNVLRRGIVDIDAASGRHIRIYAPEAELDALAPVVEALPDMVRALMGLRNLLERADETGCHIETVEKALRKAGVLP